MKVGGKKQWSDKRSSLERQLRKNKGNHQPVTGIGKGYEGKWFDANQQKISIFKCNTLRPINHVKGSFEKKVVL